MQGFHREKRRFSIDDTFPYARVASSIGTNAPPTPSDMQAFELSADNKLDDPLYL